jgi:serine/threonine protein kinase
MLRGRPKAVNACHSLAVSGFHSLIGKQVDRYEVLEQLGQGGFGAVYRARHTILGTEVALKTLWPDHADDATSVERFLREARAAASIGNEHIVHVGDAGRTPDGIVFLVMELLYGEDLEHAIDTRGPLSIEESVDITRQVLRALSAAHAHGIVHRDLKPANVFLTHKNGERFVKLLDFGISKIIGAKSLTITGMVLGTPQYMAPEQLEGTRTVDARADLYAAGSILYEMIAKRVPFEGTSFDVIVKRIQGERPPPLTTFAPHVPPSIAAITARALAPDRDGRFESADAMALALSQQMPEGFAEQGVATIPPRSAPPDHATVPSGPPPAMEITLPSPPRVPIDAAPIVTRPVSQPALIPVTSTPQRLLPSSPAMPAAQRSIHPGIYAAIGALAVLIAVLFGAVGVAAYRRFLMDDPAPPKPLASAPDDRPQTIEIVPSNPEPREVPAPQVIEEEPAPPPPPDPPPPPATSIDPAAIRFSAIEVTGTRAPIEALLERARPRIAECATARPLHVSVHFIATLTGVISVAQPHPTRPSDDEHLAQCAADAIREAGPVSFRGLQTAIVEADIDLPAREPVR